MWALPVASMAQLHLHDYFAPPGPTRRSTSDVCSGLFGKKFCLFLETLSVRTDSSQDGVQHTQTLHHGSTAVGCVFFYFCREDESGLWALIALIWSQTRTSPTGD